MKICNKIKKKTSINNTNNTNNNSNNINNSNNTTNNTTYNFTLNAYGEENRSYITDNDYLKCFDKGIECVDEYIKLKHFNPNHPENHNVFLPNLQLSYYKKYDGLKFIKVLINKTIQDIIEDNFMELDDKWYELNEKIEHVSLNRYKIFINRYDGDERDTILKDLSDNIKLLLNNEKSMPIKIQKSLKTHL